jgi:hypothetical protein
MVLVAVAPATGDVIGGLEYLARVELLCEATTSGRGRRVVGKDSSAEELIRAVRAVAGGDSYLDPAAPLVCLPPTGKAANAPRDNAIAELTDRELDVLTLIGKAPPTTGSLRH